MSKQVYYVPILKAKQSESIALRRLEPKIKPYIQPLLELQPRDNQRLLNRTIGQLERSWDRDLPLFLDVDPNYITENEDEAIRNFLQVIEHGYPSGRNTVPVTAISRSKSYQEAISSVLQKEHGICFRLTNEDWFDLDQLNLRLEELISYFKTTRKNTDIILDFGAFLPSQSATIVTSATTIINNLKYINNFRTLIFSATAFPASLGFAPKSVNTIPRSEWRIWLALKNNKTLSRIPLFGDYTTVHPVFPELDFRYVKIAPKIKYATEDAWLFIRWDKHDWSGFRDVCRALIQQPHYSGSSFSWADEYISQCAATEQDTGSPQQWVTLGINHHLTLVSKQCASRPAV